MFTRFACGGASARVAFRASGMGGAGAFGGGVSVAFRRAVPSGTFAQQVGHCTEPVGWSADTSESHAGQSKVTSMGHTGGWPVPNCRT